MKFSKALLAALLVLPGLCRPVLAGNSPLELLQQKHWIHGAPDCGEDTGPAVEVYEYRPDSYILRQNKCLTFEAPFMYLLVGNESASLLDKGALSAGEQEPLLDQAAKTSRL